MSVSLVTTLGARKAETRSELVTQLLNESEVFLNVQWSNGAAIPDLVWIEFRGALASIPSLKNSRNKFGGLTMRTKAYLQAMDAGFNDAIQREGFRRPYFGSEPVFIALGVYGRRDDDNTSSTVKDWLEPRTKLVGQSVKRERGWGVGLIDNDREARCFPLPASDLALSIKHSRIVIRPWNSIREAAVNFHAQACLIGGGAE